MAKYLSTGIDTLDALLGGNGIPTRSAVLIRGEPGTGKTTLAFQIARYNLEQDEAFSVLWIGVEQEPQAGLHQILDSLWGEDYQSFARRFENRFHTLYFPLVGPDSPYRLDSDADLSGGGPGEREPETRTSLRDFLCSLFHDRGIPVETPSLIVIDSLNALTHLAQTMWPRTSDDRQVPLDLLYSFGVWRRQKSQWTAVFTAEAPNDASSIAAHSYVADVVVELGYDDLRYQLPSAFFRPVERRLCIERLLSCRVTKGRGLPTQRRSSCYEFAKRGLKFFPTYASPGIISLFYENRPQLEEIDEFRTVDVPRQFPRLVVQGFSQPGLQRMFAIQRYHQRIPPRHSIAVSSIDEYWVGVLRQMGLLHPITPEKLELYSMPGSERADAPNATLIIEELASTKRDFYRGSAGEYFAVPYMANVGMLVYRRDLLDEVDRRPPDTWEELEEICELLRSKSLPHKFLLETQTYDTLMATALELCWSHGAVWYTTPMRGSDGLDVHYEEGGFDDVAEAFTRLHRWFHCQGKMIVPDASSVDPDRYPNVDWAFARHWYSTWIDAQAKYAAVRPEGDRVERVPALTGKERYGIWPLPIAQAYREKCHQNNVVPAHRSAWGEWYLMIQSGAENVELGVELVNNLMTSGKVTARALSGAGIPTLRPFYDTWGGSRCVGTDMTYNDIRRTFFKHARSRTDFANYRKTARILSGALHAVVSNPGANARDLLLSVVNQFRRPSSWS